MALCLVGRIGASDCGGKVTEHGQREGTGEVCERACLTFIMFHGDMKAVKEAAVVLVWDDERIS